ncbi:Astacin [Trichostrongylus colubriformis]|uniref:Astacin n=1 Tax=Trichostrongylus colubriformis TaxID=6319 RepID=A0AAN8F9H9_TRICO
MKALWERLKKMRLFKRDKVNEKGDCIEEVNEKNNITGELYQVDMLLTEEQAEEIVQGVNDTIAEMESATNGTGRIKRQAFKDQRYPAKLWSEGVKYYFHSFASMKMRNAFLKGAKLWEKDTCIDFAQSRVAKDRIMTPTTNDNYGLEYDYGSVMHYGGNSASFNKKPTMVPNDVDYQQTLGSPFISFIDLDMLNQHYNCKERCNPAKSAKCEMGGFPHPRNCQKCICPGGYGGDLCNERPPGCGETIRASEKWTRFEDEVGLGGDEVEDFMTCNYWIEKILLYDASLNNL